MLNILIMVYLLISRMLIYIFLFLNNHCHFLCFVWYQKPYQWKVLPFGLATTPSVFISLTKPIHIPCHCKGFHIIIYLDDIMVLTCSQHAGKRSFLLLLSHGLSLNTYYFFQVWTPSHAAIFFLGLFWETVEMFVSLPCDKLFKVLQLSHALLWRQPFTVHQLASFWGKTILCVTGHTQLHWLCHVIQSNMLNVYNSLTHIFLLFTFPF